MHVIVVTNRKGGSGKSTTTSHLGVHAAAKGKKVCLIDTDPQGTLSDWWNERASENPQFIQVDVAKLGSAIANLREAGFDYVLIDTPPLDILIMRQVLECADLALIPTRPSPNDLRAVQNTTNLCESLGKTILFFLNGAAPRARITAEAAVFLSSFGAVAPVIWHQRTEFASSMTDGRTAQELNPTGKSSEEISKLWDFVVKQLKKKKVSS